ncbi:hypothetical protein F7734_36835 [Scytonema sp. UIC 10036]|uniref:hypothetical protein n=1 Tax=Scytonema sp. UIC 10036 TaxID=2304196 RepID=UPI0012DAD40E|nr:hypothetical protein [Scytonema sp. UIC 10036]MUG97590.1 hypothetical protein [Scytonema sp. UIC 10036]
MFPLLSRVNSTPSLSSHPELSKSTPHSLLVKKVIWCNIILFVFIFLPNSTAHAHKVKTAADVGATLHLEPNDNPRAGEATKTWFALTRRGGKVIPLTECNCQLAVYAEPYSQKEPPLLEPSLQPVVAEKYKGIPGSEIIFPRPGAYLLQLSGKPKKEGSFQPFELKFSVTVAAGSATTEPVAVNNTQVQDPSSDVNPSQSQGTPIWAIASLALAVLGVSFAVLRSRKRD